ncbi:holin-associated N-acetylmuramidase [Cognatishimia maritima]|uniref:Predicted Peptidoglycan domain-containing protein n=1 Tax=Cognatishimia maritima TaxID=870908 RepID=A0A1M5JA73_9RHOB|nr:holin-associated N-acetylmuramidase [Cognatishimia maritima]SHG37457.1 Predicted Peptidoglycan domain-containing protein [Cognatishimia maritima]
MPDVRQIAAEIVAREGGFVDDPDDPGGATKHGVTLATLRRLGLDLDKDGDVDEQDVRRVSRDLAIDLFVQHYFEAPGIARLPQVLHASVFDMQVNAGSNAVKILQRLLNQMGQRVLVDGVIGPQTIAAADAAAAMAPDHLADAYAIARRNYYFRLADARANLRKFVRTRRGGKGGWITRAEGFMSPRYHLTDQEFDSRVAAWR